MASKSPIHDDKPLTLLREKHNNADLVIIGGGIAGMCAAIDHLRTHKNGKLVIFEKGGGFGGTWRDNVFPGCCCDVYSNLYSFSFEQNPDWTHFYPNQEEILAYLTSVAQKYHLYKYVRFNTTVDEARWNENKKRWDVTVIVNGGKDSEYGSGYSVTSDFLISCVGQLNIPKYPLIAGLDSFEGKIMHSARWDWSYPLGGKKIAIVGTGATAAQIVPEVAKVADHLTVLQRTPAWVIPRHDSIISERRKLLLRHVQPARQWFRAESMKVRESFYEAVTQAESAKAKQMLEIALAHMRKQLPDRPDLWKKFTPSYSPGCKRSVLSDDYFPTFLRDNVTLEPSPISRITKKGILFQGQESETEFDLIILATGFETFDYMHPLKVFGRKARSLTEIWHGLPRAYKGVTVEDVPNFGMLYGPNTNLSHNSLILVIEAQSRYINTLVDAVLDVKAHGKHLSLMPKLEVIESYNLGLQKMLNKTSFADPNCNSWWKNSEGIITNNWSGTAVDYQNLISDVIWEDYEIEETDGSETFVLRRKARTHIGRVKEETHLSTLTLREIFIKSWSFLNWLCNSWDSQKDTQYEQIHKLSSDSEHSELSKNNK